MEEMAGANMKAYLLPSAKCDQLWGTGHDSGDSDTLYQKDPKILICFKHHLIEM